MELKFMKPKTRIQVDLGRNPIASLSYSKVILLSSLVSYSIMVSLMSGLSPFTRTLTRAVVFVSSCFSQLPISLPIQRSISSCQKWSGSRFMRIQKGIIAGIRSVVQDSLQAFLTFTLELKTVVSQICAYYSPLRVPLSEAVRV